jgi:putative endopeptidase
MNAPTDTDRWFMTPQTVNAYYHPSLNEIVFPAAILQPPFFDPEADLAVQYGSLGAVVGHEMTHGFDDQGRKYDDNGNLRDWWSPEDGLEYSRRVEVMVAQAGEFEVHGLKLNGKLTCGENVADLGGVKLALRALKSELTKQYGVASAAPLINGFTPVQRLFLAWSQNWRENVKKERAIQLVTLDPHGPNEMRCNGTLRNVDEFHEAFGVSEGSPMFLSKEKRVDIW